MEEKQSFFHKNKYVYLSNFLDKENCQQYVQEFKKLIEQGPTIQDHQCPLSHSLGYTPLFDSLLEQLTPNIEAATGKKLLPTYAYARWYAPGDELKIHKDRPACEISATITLGFEGGQWPIYVGHESNKQDAKQINMNVGDAVIYKGCELFHWREKYTEGQWQAQVFIHYVDQEGPNAEWKYDKREKLAHHEEENNLAHLKNDRFKGVFTVIKNGFSRENCQNIINKLEKNYGDEKQQARLVGDIIDKQIRDSKKIELSITNGVATTLIGMGIQLNNDIWKFNVTHSNQSDFLKYDSNGHFASHIDIITSQLGSHHDCRKITCLLILNDNFEGGKFYLQDGKEKIYPRQEVGDVIFFPSFLLHGVEPVITGTRYSVVTWLVGPSLK